MNFTEFVGFFTDYINPYSGLPGIIFYLLYRSKMGNISRWVFYILSASFLADFAIQIFIRYVYPNSYILSNVWYLINYVLMSQLFLLMIPNRKKLIFYLEIIFFTGAFISFAWLYSFLESNTFIKTFSSIVFTAFAILAFYQILKESPTKKLANYPIFWINTGLFLFSSISLFRNLFSNYLVFTEQISWDLLAPVALFGVFFNVIKNIMIFYAFILVKKGNVDYIYEPKPATS